MFKAIEPVVSPVQTYCPSPRHIGVVQEAVILSHMCRLLLRTLTAGAIGGDVGEDGWPRGCLVRTAELLL